MGPGKSPLNEQMHLGCILKEKNFRRKDIQGKKCLFWQFTLILCDPLKEVGEGQRNIRNRASLCSSFFIYIRQNIVTGEESYVKKAFPPISESFPRSLIKTNIRKLPLLLLGLRTWFNGNHSLGRGRKQFQLRLSPFCYVGTEEHEKLAIGWQLELGCDFDGNVPEPRNTRRRTPMCLRSDLFVA